MVGQRRRFPDAAVRAGAAGRDVQGGWRDRAAARGGAAGGSAGRARGVEREAAAGRATLATDGHDYCAGRAVLTDVPRSFRGASAVGSPAPSGRRGTAATAESACRGPAESTAARTNRRRRNGRQRQATATTGATSAAGATAHLPGTGRAGSSPPAKPRAATTGPTAATRGVRQADLDSAGTRPHEGYGNRDISFTTPGHAAEPHQQRHNEADLLRRRCVVR